MSDTFYISQNEEWFNEGPFDTREEAIAEGHMQYNNEPFFIAERVDYVPFQRDWLDEALENEQNDVYDECGSDASDNWPERLRKDHEYEKANEEIRAILLRMYGKPTVFKAENCEKIVPETSEV